MFVVERVSRPAARRSFGRYALAGVLLSISTAGSASAQTARGPATVETLHQAIESAWSRLPQTATYRAQQGLAAAHYAAGSAFFPNAPYSAGEYDDDRAGSNDGFRTTRVELGTPIWLPGEGTATERAAIAESNSISAATEAARLDVASEVLDIVLRAQLGLDAVMVARHRLEADQALANSVARRFEVGEGSRADSLAASAAVDDDNVTLSSEQATLDASLVALGTATGLEVVPSLPDDRGKIDTVDARAAPSVETNAKVMAAEKALVEAQEKARLVRIADRDDPELGLQLTNDKQPGTPWDTRAGVVFRIPFASEARNAPRRAEAALAVARAEVSLELARREVAAALRDAASLYAARHQAALSAARAASALRTRSGEIKRAWEQGEMPLIELVRAQAALFDAELAASRSATERDAARQGLIIASGAVP